VNDTLSTPDPATQVAEVRQILEGRTVMHSCEATLLAIRRVIFPPAPEGPPAELTERGWPKLKPSDWIDTGTGPGYGPEHLGTERHDDPRA
jgi:hypothetical protein